MEKKYSKLAIASFVCGVLSFFIFPFILGTNGFIIGVGAIRQVNKSGDKGKGLAIAGIVGPYHTLVDR